MSTAEDEDDNDETDDFFDSLTIVVEVVVIVVAVVLVVVVCCKCFLTSFVSRICNCGDNGNTCFEVEGVDLGGRTVRVVGCTVPTGVELLVILVEHSGLIFLSGFGDMELHGREGASEHTITTYYYLNIILNI